jgi:hypothetical protein
VCGPSHYPNKRDTVKIRGVTARPAGQTRPRAALHPDRLDRGLAARVRALRDEVP